MVRESSTHTGSDGGRHCQSGREVTQSSFQRTSPPTVTGPYFSVLWIAGSARNGVRDIARGDRFSGCLGCGDSAVVHARSVKLGLALPKRLRGGPSH